MNERFGNLGKDLNWQDLNSLIGALNEFIDEHEKSLEKLEEMITSGQIDAREREDIREALVQQLTIAKYKRDAYLSRL